VGTLYNTFAVFDKEKSALSKSLEILVLDNREKLFDLEERIGYCFQDRELLQLALIHASYGFEQVEGGLHNETLEFLGDAVLDLTVGYLLFNRFPDMREGKLTRLRAALVNENGLAVMAGKLELGSFLLLGKGEEGSGGREKSSILSCAFEAVLGALFQDGGYDEAMRLVRRLFEPVILEEQEMLLTLDPKSSLQEMLQERHNEGPQYVLEKEEGPAHARSFTVTVRFHDKVLGNGRAGSKKEAEQQAAAEAIHFLEEK
jgi:ribonuclease-3